VGFTVILAAKKAGRDMAPRYNGKMFPFPFLWAIPPAPNHSKNIQQAEYTKEDHENKQS